MQDKGQIKRLKEKLELAVSSSRAQQRIDQVSEREKEAKLVCKSV